MTFANTAVATMRCPACAGKGWLPLQPSGLPLEVWVKTLCRECAGGGAAPGADAEPERTPTGGPL